MTSRSDLNGNNFTPKQRKAISLLATGDIPISEILTECNISSATFWRWRKNPYFMNEVILEARNNLSDALPDIYKKLTESARQGDFKYVKLFLDHLDKLEEQKTNQSDATISFTWRKREDK